ncbi:hypothetical protein NEUTE2DRAFT_65061 [Neurospora tetrasperma FGSC 2509]|nr:hypothetical protein NEUTE2DRAFT_65061 [Neurospora tetrasperma FGSC 2509]
MAVDSPLASSASEEISAIFATHGLTSGMGFRVHGRDGHCLPEAQRLRSYSAQLSKPSSIDTCANCAARRLTAPLSFQVGQCCFDFRRNPNGIFHFLPRRVLFYSEKRLEGGILSLGVVDCDRMVHCKKMVHARKLVGSEMVVDIRRFIGRHQTITMISTFLKD